MAAGSIPEVVFSPRLEIATELYAQDDRVEITAPRGCS